MNRVEQKEIVCYINHIQLLPTRSDLVKETLQRGLKDRSRLCEDPVAQTCSVKKVFWEISQNSQEKACARVSFLIMLQAPPATLLKKTPWHRCFPVNFAKFLRTPFFTEHLRWLLLSVDRSTL